MHRPGMTSGIRRGEKREETSKQQLNSRIKKRKKTNRFFVIKLFFGRIPGGELAGGSLRDETSREKREREREREVFPFFSPTRNISNQNTPIKVMALQLPHISWWNVSSAQVTRCELHRLEDGCDWLTYKATALKRRLSNFPNECVDIGFLQTTTTKSSDVSCNPFGFGGLGSILKGRGDGNVNGKDSGIPLYCVLGNRRKETLVNFDKSFDKRGDLSLQCCSHDASLKTPKNANKFVFQIGQTTKSSARNRKHELCEEYVFELRSVWSGTEVLELVLKVRFEMQGRCSDVLRMTGLSCIRVPVHVKSQAADVNCKYWGTEEETGGVTCDRTSPCCQEKFTIAHHMEENTNHTWIEAG